MALTPSTFLAAASARRRSAAEAAVPHSVTLPSAAVTSMPAAWIFASLSRARFTRAASSLLGSGFGGSGVTTGGGDGGVGAAACGGGAAGFGAGLGVSSPQAARPSTIRPISVLFMLVSSVNREQLGDRVRVEAVFVVAHLVADHDFALLGKYSLDFGAPEAAQHVFHLLLVVRAVVLHGIKTEDAHQLFREYACQQIVGLRIARLVEREGVGEVLDPVPAVGIAGVCAGQLLEQQAAERAAVGVEAQERLELLRLREVMLENLLHRLALERHQALVDAAAFHVLQGHGEAAVAQQLPLAEGRLLLGLVAGHPPDLQVGGAVGDEQLDRARALHLHGYPARALLIRSQEHVQRGGVAEQGGDVLR